MIGLGLVLAFAAVVLLYDYYVRKGKKDSGKSTAAEVFETLRDIVKSFGGK